MKRILYGIVGVIMAMPSFAVDDPIVGDKTTTSQPYVYNQIETTQVKIPAANPSNTNIGSTVVTYTNVAGGGTIGERGVFTGGEYNASDDADKLITASALNNTFTNLPTTDTTTLQCANQDCTLWTIVDQTAYGETITLPAGYTRLEYIQSTGTQYIETGIRGQANLMVETTVMGTGDLGIIFSFDQDYSGSYVGDSGSKFRAAGTFSDSNSLNKTFIRTSWAQNSTKLTQTTTIDNQTITYTNYVRTPSTITIFRGANWNSDSSYWIGRVYSFKAYINNELVQDLVPAKNSSNVVGMYDIVNNRFYTKQGTDDFIAGPVVN